MGQYKITVVAVGGHGCSREVKDGGTVVGCKQPSCPDCTARVFVEKLKASGQNIAYATLHHWPGTDSEVQDNLLTGVRAGQFGR